MLHWQLSHHQFSWPTHCDSRIHGLPPSVAAYTQHRLIWSSSTCSPKLCLNSRECGIFNSKALRQPLITCPSSPSHGIQVPYVHWNEKGLDIDYHVSSYCTCIHNSVVVCQPHSFLVAHWLWIRGVASNRPWLALPADNLHLLVASKYAPKSCHLPSHVDTDRLYVASTSFRIPVTSVAPLPQEEKLLLIQQHCLLGAFGHPLFWPLTLRNRKTWQNHGTSSFSIPFSLLIPAFHLDI